MNGYLKSVVGVGLMALLVLSGMVVLEVRAAQTGSIQVNNAEEANFPEMAKITLDGAIKAALQAVPGKALRAELEDEDGYLVYEVEVASADHQITEVEVDAGTGKILNTELDRSDKESHDKEHTESDHENEE